MVLSFNAWKSLKVTQILRYLLKLAIATFWLIVMPLTYSRSIQNPTGIMRLIDNLGADWQNQDLYYYCIAIYFLPNILASFLFLFPFLRRVMERSNWRIVVFLMWWAQVSWSKGAFLTTTMINCGLICLSSLPAKAVCWKRNAWGYVLPFQVRCCCRP